VASVSSKWNPTTRARERFKPSTALTSMAAQSPSTKPANVLRAPVVAAAVVDMVVAAAVAVGTAAVAAVVAAAVAVAVDTAVAAVATISCDRMV
jgi:hypothetical protein